MKISFVCIQIRVNKLWNERIIKENELFSIFKWSGGFVCGPSEAYLFICWSDCSIYSAFIIKFFFAHLFTFDVRSNAPDSNQGSFHILYTVCASSTLPKAFEVSGPDVNSSDLSIIEALSGQRPSLKFPEFPWAINMKHNITCSAMKASYSGINYKTLFIVFIN